MFKILHFNNKNGASVVFNMSLNVFQLVVPPYEEKNLKVLSEAFDKQKIIESASSHTELKEKLRMMLSASFLDFSYTFFARLSDSMSPALTPAETRRIFLKHAVEEIKKTPISDSFVFTTFAMNYTIGLSSRDAAPIISAIERQNDKKAIYLRKMLEVKPIDWKEESDRLIDYAQKTLLPHNEFKVAKAILQFVARSGLSGIEKHQADKALELFKEATRCEKGYLHAKGVDTSVAWKKWVPSRQKLHPSAIMTSKINKNNKDEK